MKKKNNCKRIAWLLAALLTVSEMTTTAYAVQSETAGGQEPAIQMALEQSKEQESVFDSAGVEFVPDGDRVEPQIVTLNEEESQELKQQMQELQDQTPEETGDVEEEDATGASASSWKAYGNNYYRKRLSKAERTLYKRMEASCDKVLTTKKSLGYYGGHYLTPIIKNPGLSKQQAMHVFEVFLSSRPQYYFLSNEILGANGMSEIYLCVRSKYSDGTKRAEATSKIQKRLANWNKQIAAQKTAIQKEKMAHDLIAKHTTYDQDTSRLSENQKADSVLLNGKSVCAGYAQTFQMLCNKAGIVTLSVTSKVHEWSKVRLYGNWFTVDCTWDDLDGVNNTQWWYRYFNRSDAVIRSSTMDSEEAHVENALWNGLAPTSTMDSGGSQTTVPGMPAPKTTRSIQASNAQKVYEKDKKFSLGATVSHAGGTMKYVSSNRNVVTVTAKGNAVIKGCGISKVTISIPATSKYKAARKQIKITVQPKQQTITKCSVKKGGKVEVQCKKDSHATSYQIAWADNSAFKKAHTLKSKKATTIQRTVTGLEKGKTYYIRVRSYKKSAGKTIWGKWSKAKKIQAK